MNDKGQVTGAGGSGTATWVFATGDAAPLKGKVLNWTFEGDGTRDVRRRKKTD